MMHLDDFINNLGCLIPGASNSYPWHITEQLPQLLEQLMNDLAGKGYTLSDGRLIHETAIIEQGVILKGPVIIGQQCFLGAGAYLRDGVYLGAQVTIGPGCELKRSIVGDHTAIAL